MRAPDRRALILTTLLILLPAIAGILLWDRLPERMATHFDFQGVPNGWSGRTFVVLGLPLLIAVVHLVCVSAVSMDPKRRNVDGKLYALTLWICPAVSLLAGATIYAAALGAAVDISTVSQVFTGLLFAALGNYLPKCRQNYTMGIKLPWTLADEDNWDRTHRLAGPLWMAGGVILSLDAFLGVYREAVFLAVVTVLAVVPIVWSAWLWYRRPQDAS